MSTNEWAAVIGCILIILATLFGCWWLLHLEWRSKNNTKVEDFDIDFNQVAYGKELEELPPIQERWPVFATPKLDLLTSAVDPAHPYSKHDMKFKGKVFSHELRGIIYKFRCLYCNFETKILFRDFWGKPRLSEEWVNWGQIRKDQERSFGMGVDHGVLYDPLDQVISLSPVARYMSGEPRSDAATEMLMAYAESIKDHTTVAIEKIESDLGTEIPPWSPYYARRLTQDELEERRQL